MRSCAEPYWFGSNQPAEPVSARRSCETSGWIPAQYRLPLRATDLLARNFATALRMFAEEIVAAAVIVAVDVAVEPE